MSKKIYVSMAIQDRATHLSEVVAFLSNMFPHDTLITHWDGDRNNYSTKKLEEADAVVFALPGLQFDAYPSRGVKSEIQTAEHLDIPVVGIYKLKTSGNYALYSYKWSVGNTIALRAGTYDHAVDKIKKALRADLGMINQEEELTDEQNSILAFLGYDPADFNPDSYWAVVEGHTNEQWNRIRMEFAQYQKEIAEFNYKAKNRIPVYPQDSDFDENWLL